MSAKRLYIGQVLLDRVTPKTADVVQCYKEQVAKASTSQKWDLGMMGMDMVPIVVPSVTSLTMLAMNDNAIAILPVELFQMTRLLHLRLQNNVIVELPAQVGNLIKLQSLWISNNQLTEFPVEVSKLRDLSMLALAKNLIKRVPIEIGHCSSLTGLTFDSNPLEIPCKQVLEMEQEKVIQYFKDLVHARRTNSIEVRRFNLIRVPLELELQWEHLVNLNLQDNKITELPESISTLTELKTLCLDNNKLKWIPKTLCILTKLRTLQLKSNELQYIPWELSMLDLAVFDLTQNAEITIPPFEIAERGLPHTMEFLKLISTSIVNKTLNFEGWQLRTLEVVNQILRLGEGLGTKEFNCSGCFFPELPAYMLELTALTSFKFASNGLLKLPSLSKFQSLKVLIAHTNRIKSMAPVLECGKLRELDLSQNSIKTIPVDIDELSQLRKLDLSNNKILTIPQEMRALSNLNVLDLSHNRIRVVPELEELSNLEILRVSFNKITDIPKFVAAVTSLAELHIDNNRLESLDPELSSAFKHLRVVELRRNPFGSLFALSTDGKEKSSKKPAVVMDDNIFQQAISGFITRTLDFGGQKLGALPAYIASMTILTDLNVSRCDLAVIPPTIGNLTNLTSLRLSQNRVTSLPEAIGCLTALTRLHLHNNALTRLPMSLGNCTRIIDIQLEDNPIVSPPKEVLVQGGAMVLKFIQRTLRAKTSKKMLASSFQLETVPLEVLDLQELTELFLDKNVLTELDQPLIQLTKLVTLSAELNQIKELMALKGEWKTSRFPALMHFKLRGNELVSIPPEIKRLTALESVYLSNNRIESIPSEITQLPALKRLELRNNKLQQLPGTMHYLTDLLYLDVAYNMIEELPFDMGKMSDQLNEFHIMGNPIRMPPKEVARSGIAALEYLWQLHKSAVSRTLDLSKRAFLKTPPEIFEIPQLHSLTSLSLEGNFITQVPAEILVLSGLRYLNVAQNRITEIPRFFLKLTNLLELALSKNPITELPFFLGDLTDLRRLGLVEMSKLEVPPLEIQMMPTKKVIQYLRKFNKIQIGMTNRLNLSKLELQRWPKTINWVTSITELRMVDNKIEELSPSISDLRLLKLLDVDKNLIASLPLALANLTDLVFFSARSNRITVLPNLQGPSSLEELLLDDNFLRSLPETVSSWGKLLHASIRRNRLKSFPKGAVNWDYITSLDLTSNDLNEVPWSISHLTSVTNLILDQNCIVSIPDSIRYCVALKNLSLQGNKIAVLNPALGRLSSLTQLGFDEEHVVFPPSEVAASSLAGILSYLTVLDIGVQCGDVDLKGWGFLAFPLEGSTVEHITTSITHLDLSHNLIQLIPPGIQLFASLRSLDVSYNKLETIPVEVEVLSSVLERFMLSGNLLVEFPGNLASLTKLKVLACDDNRIKEFPFWFNRLCSLEELRLARNRIKIMPPSLCKMTSVIKLSLVGNPIREIPLELVDLPNLEQVVVTIDRLRCMKVWRKDVQKYALIARHGVTVAPSEVVANGEGALWIYLRVMHGAVMSNELDLSNKGFWRKHMGLPNEFFRALPPPVTDLLLLSKINLRGNRLQELPPEISRLQSLTVLDLTENNLIKLPFEIAQITTLQRLLLYSNMKLTLPSKEIAKLGSSATIEYISNWRTVQQDRIFKYVGMTIENVPLDVFEFSDMTLLDISGNCIRSFPDECIKLTALTYLNLSRNILTTLPESIGGLSRLEELFLDRNFLLELPETVHQLSSLRYLSANHNLMVNVPHEVAKEGAARSLDFLVRVSKARRTGELDLSGFDMYYVPVEMFTMGSPPGLQSTVLKPLLLWVQDQMEDRVRFRDTAEGNDLDGEVTPDSSDSEMLSKMEDPRNKSRIMQSRRFVAERLVLVPNAKKTYRNAKKIGYYRKDMKVWLKKENTVGVGKPAKSRHLKYAMEEKFGKMDKKDKGWHGVRIVGDEDSVDAIPMDERAVRHRVYLSALEGITDVRNQGVSDVIGAGIVGGGIKDFGLLPEEEGMFETIWAAATQNINIFTVMSMGKVTALESLNLSHNLITQIPISIKGHLPALKRIDLSYNVMSIVPAEMMSLTSLTYMSLASNSLGSLPKAWCALTALTELNLSNNDFKKFPAVIAAFQSLVVLNLGGNKISILASQLGSLVNLESLDCSHNELKEVTPLIRNLQKLKKLNLAGNHELMTLPPFICELTSLEELGLHDCHFPRLPTALKFLSNLRKLSVHRNKLSRVQRELASLDVAYLRLNSNEIQDHRFIYDITTLVRLHLQDNLIRAIDDQVGNLQLLEQLLLSRNVIEHLPESLGELSRLLDLRLSYNRLERLPESLSKLNRLTLLATDHNNLTTLPSCMGGCTNLVQLWAEQNKIESVSSELKNLQRLQTLHLDSNKLAALPAQLQLCSALTELWLDDNILGSGYGVPEAVYSFTNLRMLTLASNALQEMPAKISKLTALEELWLQDNDIPNLPKECVHLTNLRVLLLDLKTEMVNVPDGLPPEIATDERHSIRNNAAKEKEKRKALSNKVKAG